MNARKSFNLSIYLSLAVVMLLSACQPVVATTIPEPTTAPVVQPTEPPAQPTEPPVLPTHTPEGVSLDYTAVAQNVPSKPCRPSPPPRRAVLGSRTTIQPPDPGRLSCRQSSVQAADQYLPGRKLAAANENMGKIAADLQTLLQTQQAGETLPFLPLLNEVQAMHAQVQYLDFSNGKGIRYLTQFNQGPVPVNNNQLIHLPGPDQRRQILCCRDIAGHQPGTSGQCPSQASRA